jgi:hypothetical protein
MVNLYFCDNSITLILKHNKTLVQHNNASPLQTTLYWLLYTHSVLGKALGLNTQRCDNLIVLNENAEAGVVSYEELSDLIVRMLCHNVDT